MAKNKYDTIIVGAGVAGLMAGAYLAKQGASVLILEKNNIVGGCYSSFRRGEFKFDSVAQIIGSCGRSGILGSILHDLGIKIDFMRLDPTDLIHFPDETVRINSDFKEFETYLQERFKKEKKSVSEFFRLLSNSDNEMKTLYIIKKYAASTYQSLLDEFFEDRILKGILSAQCGCFGLPPEKLAATSAIFLLKTYIIDGAYYPKGGSQEFSDSIVRAFKSFGGDIMLNSAIDKIIVEDNKVKGVRLNGSEILAGSMISAGDLPGIYKTLIGLDKIKGSNSFYQKLNSFQYGNSSCIVYLGLSKKLDIKDKNGWYYPSYDINKDLGSFMNIHIPTEYDGGLSEKGNKILIATFLFDYKNDRKDNRKEFKRNLMEQYLGRLKGEVPDITENILVKDIATPLTIERYTSNSTGAIGWNPLPTQTHLNAFPVSSPISGLFHAGQWTLPGSGIVAVAASGINAARKILKSGDKKKTVLAWTSCEAR